MRKFFYLMLFMGALLALSASEKELNSSQNQWIKDLKILVALSDKNRSMLKGDDTNNNGVRDDVEEFILSKYSNNPFQRDMFFKAAKKIETILTLPEELTIQERVKLDRELLEIYTCRDYILYRNRSENIKEELLNKTLFKGKVLNTSQRLKTYIEHKKKLPLNFSELSEDELSKNKKSCLAIYYSYDNQKPQSKIEELKKDKKQL